MSKFPEIKPMGERAILVEFWPKIDEDLLDEILSIKQIILKNTLKLKLEVVTTYSSLLVVYESDIEDVYGEIFRLEKLLREANIEKRFEKKLFHIPVCYEQAFALDLDYISDVKKMNNREIIKLHSTPVYTVYFIGFLPGFLYLGGLDEKLIIPRKNEPRLRVKKGAVGIGQNQTGIYPQESPGGWQIIGNCPVPLFDKNQTPPSVISAGDKIKFYSIGMEEHEQIRKEVSEGIFQFRKETYEG